jgi:hypothetical protein
MLLVGAGLVALLAIGAIAFLIRNNDGPVRTSYPGPPPSESVPAETPTLEFTKATKELVRTAPGPINRRHRKAIEHAATTVRSILTDLYTEAFLDPANWQQGRYTDAFGAFAGGARKEAEAHPDLLTAGAQAGERYDSILPESGRVATRILLDRTGRPTLLVSIVRFSAAALGAEPFTFRSDGQFFFERIHGSWRIVSFHVTRTDARSEGT